MISMSPSMSDLKKTYMALMKKSRKHTSDEVAHVIFVYIGGHGATQNEKQLYLLNSNEPGQAIFQIEFKLRYLIQDALSMARIFCVFDCCRVPISNMPGLATGRGAGGNDDEEPPSDEELPNKYFQIQACGPGGIAAADGGFAKRLLDTCKKYAAKKPAGFMWWPRDFAKARWSPGEIATSGGEDYMMPFGENAA